MHDIILSKDLHAHIPPKHRQQRQIDRFDRINFKNFVREKKILSGNTTNRVGENICK